MCAAGNATQHIPKRPFSPLIFLLTPMPIQAVSCICLSATSMSPIAGADTVPAFLRTSPIHSLTPLRWQYLLPTPPPYNVGPMSDSTTVCSSSIDGKISLRTQTPDVAFTFLLCLSFVLGSDLSSVCDFFARPGYYAVDTYTGLMSILRLRIRLTAFILCPSTFSIWWHFALGTSEREIIAWHIPADGNATLANPAGPDYVALQSQALGYFLVSSDHLM
ncbi:hypothetical protein MVEN_00475200 [Mycena venus]|uniref:Uncharacterized protein n=1 Tax=Mycena venus TaxID=2733690 RepID=A0A8H6YTE3_9AGAR|nr:hypothetical protein MVEN_00475200 [Mycena venus]